MLAPVPSTNRVSFHNQCCNVLCDGGQREIAADSVAECSVMNTVVSPLHTQLKVKCVFFNVAQCSGSTIRAVEPNNVHREVGQQSV